MIEKRGGFGSAFLGGVIAAVIGAGVAIWAIPNLPPQLSGWLPNAPTPVDGAAIQSQLDDQSKQISQLSEELATLKSSQPPAPDLSGVQSALDQVNADIRTNKSALEDLKSQIASLQSDNGGSAAQAEIEAAAKAAEARIKEAEAQAQSLKSQSEAAAKAAMTQAAAARVKAALDAGTSLDAPLADLRDAGVDIPAALNGDIPSLQSLQSSFPDAARAALQAARRTETGGSISDRVGAFLLAQTGARSVAPKEGDGADAVLSRAQADVDRGALSDALDEIAKLPDPAQEAMSDWVNRAKTRMAAIDAANQLGATQ
ncbi:hypothetical protein B6V74_17175 [Thioclava sp. F42-5]|nr:hypothetical protein B6V74_17175 [Thioclava sp. F42-5]